MKGRVAPLLAARYLTGKKSHSAVNIIALVAICGVAVATAAIICVLSVFNGFRDVLTLRLDRLSPELVVLPSSGKIITPSDSLTAEISKIKGVAVASESLTDQALIIVNNQEMPVRLKGINPDKYRRITAIDSILIEGSSPLQSTPRDFEQPADALIAIGIAARTQSHRGLDKITIFAPKRIGRLNPANPVSGFIIDSIAVNGIFQSEQSEFDNDYVLTDITTVRNLMMRDDNEATSIEIALAPGASPDKIKEQIANLGAGKLKVYDRQEQQRDNYRMISIEKWMTYLLLFFILIVASFNIISTLCVLVIEKKNSMQTMRALGMSRNEIGKVFAWESCFVTLIGGINGLLLGVILVELQEKFGLIHLNAPGDTLIVSAYPVHLEALDLLWTLLPVFITGAICSLISFHFSKSRS